MRNRMKQLARGKFEYDVPEIQFSDESLSLTVVEGDDYSGSFSLSNKKMTVRLSVYLQSLSCYCKERESHQFF